jgi:2-(1,2-epoxy-1,2-dihydrophenyl)acetyl-CoA isomerase
VTSRPDALNAFTNSLKLSLRETIETLAADATCRALVLAGAGRAFCVGQDLKEHVEILSSRDDAAADTVVTHYNPLVRSLATFPKPVVAAVRGVAAGAGASLALLADFRVGVRTRRS